ncbi:hypothetical protein CGRA01v4_07507 [Colletotrichum graminicola]|nr:hypothetical protein CGRA01v4_07507 [Colletotrichum graminicola]
MNGDYGRTSDSTVSPCKQVEDLDAGTAYAVEETGIETSQATR